MDRKQLIDLTEAVIGRRTALLTVDEFAQIVNMSPNRLRQRCAREESFATQRCKHSTYKIPVDRLSEYLT